MGLTSHDYCLALECQFANGHADALVTMQRTDLSDEARENAVWDLMRFSSEVMKGNVPLG